MRTLQAICHSICDVEGGMMEGRISFKFDRLMMAMKAPHPCMILDDILSGIYWTVRDGDTPSKEQLAKTIKEFEGFIEDFEVEELRDLVDELKEHLNKKDDEDGNSDIEDDAIEELIRSEEFQCKTKNKVYYIDGVYVTFINGVMGEDSMELTPDEILSPLSTAEKEEQQKIMDKYGIPSWDYFEGLLEYADDEDAYDLFDEEDEEAIAIIDKIIEDIENDEFPYDSIAEFSIELMRNGCKEGEYNYFYEGEMFSIYDSLDRSPRGSYLEFTNEEWMKILNNIDEYEI